MEPALAPVDPECPQAVTLLRVIALMQSQALLQSQAPPVAALCEELLSSLFSPEEATTLCDVGRDLAQTTQNRISLFPESFRAICVLLEWLLGDGGLNWAQVEDIVIYWPIPGDRATYTAQEFVLTQCYIQPILGRSPNLRHLILPFGLVVRPPSGIDVAGNSTPTELDKLIYTLYDEERFLTVRSFRDILKSSSGARFAVTGRERFLKLLLSSPDSPLVTPIAVDVWQDELDMELLDRLLAQREQLRSLHIPLTGESLGSWTFTNLEELGITVELRSGISTIQRFAFLPRTVPNCPKLRTLRITRIAGSEPSNLEEINHPLAASVAPFFDSLLVGWTSNGETGTLYEVYVDRHCAWRRVAGENYGLPPTVTGSTEASR